MSTWQIYLLFQIPGWVLAALILAALRLWVGIPVWVAYSLFAVYVLKDFVLYPLLWKAYEPGVKTGAEALVGIRGIAHQDLTPSGYVRVRGELWHAEAEANHNPIKAGTPIRVLAAQGMTLIVEAEKK